MDIIFNCPKCEQELAVDSSGAGTEIDCPSCGEKIVIPAPPGGVAAGNIIAAASQSGSSPINPIATSAAAKVEKHLKVPVHDKPVASLISKPPKPLDVAAKESDRKLKVKTIRHSDCIEVGHDRFDEAVTEFLQKVGENNIVSITPLDYTRIDVGSQKLMTDYAVMVVYRG